jgi:hypothetical protein
MPIRFNRCRMITVFPVGTYSTLSQIEFLPRPSRNQLDRFGYYVSITIYPGKLSLRNPALCGKDERD